MFAKIRTILKKSFQNFPPLLLTVLATLYVVLPLILSIWWGQDGWWIGLGLCTIYIIQSIGRLGATKENPTPIGLLVLFGRKTSIIFREGLCLVPALVGRLIEENGRKQKKVFVIKDKNLYTSEDNTIIYFPSILIIYRIKNLFNYLDIDDPFEWIEDRIKVALKDFINYNIDGPKKWTQVRDLLNEKFVKRIISKLLGQTIPVYENDLGDEKKKGMFKKEEDFTRQEKDNKELVLKILEGMRSGDKTLELDSAGLEIFDIVVDAPDTTDEMKKAIEQIAEEQRAVEREVVERTREEYDLETKLQLAEKLHKRLEIDGNESLLRVLQITKIVPGNATNERIYRGATGNLGVVELLKEEVTGGKK